VLTRPGARATLRSASATTSEVSGLETWGFCRGCDRWFYVGASAAADPALTRCPVCATQPESLRRTTDAGPLEAASGE
jgi:sarcosine oxidase delta subunit